MIQVIDDVDHGVPYIKRLFDRTLPVFSQGMTSITGSMEVDCIIAAIRAFNRGNLGILERIVKASYIEQQNSSGWGL